jgi:hypothetical protein
MRLMAAGEFSPYYHAANVNDWHEEIAMSAICEHCKETGLGATPDALELDLAHDRVECVT